MQIEDRLNNTFELVKIMDHSIINEDAIKVLCGKKLGFGVTRAVYEYNLDPENYVIKIEPENNGANRKEYDFWDEVQFTEHKKWFAPCVWISPAGRMLVQRRTKPITDLKKIPEKIPAFLKDTKYLNFGWLGKQLVMHDYGYVADLKFTKAMMSKDKMWGNLNH